MELVSPPRSANGAGSVTSNSATLTVNAAAPTITTQPQSQTVALGQAATFSVAAGGTAPLNYQWSKNNTAITGATSSSYTTPETAIGDNGATFAVTVSNTAGNITSNAATLTVHSTGTAIAVTIDPLANRHPISAYVYGGSYPKNAATVTDSGLSVVRWGGNATSTYNWQLHTYNADNDWYFEDFGANGFSDNSDGDSVQFINDVKTAGSNPLMTMVMLPWVAKSAEDGVNGHWSFSVIKYGAQCGFDQYNHDAGNGLKTDCSTHLTADPNDAYFPLLDDPTATCPAAASCVYRNQWATALATAFGASSRHFYDMDNEADIWGGTHFDIHRNPTGYEEWRDTYLAQARNLKVWDSAAIRLGPVSCCWWFYWNGANSNDKAAHGNVDLLPWWLNEVYWHDQIDATRSVDLFDIHAYPDGPDTSSLTTAQKQALATRVYRDYWDPAYTSESGTVTQVYATSIQPQHAIPFRIPRLRAMVNMIYPGTPLAITEWSAEFAGAADFSTALGDADAYGILGRECVYLASRWTAADPANPNYQALKLYTNYDGSHHGFGDTSISATHSADPNFFSVYASLSRTGAPLRIMVINKDPVNAAQVTFALSHFTTGTYSAFTLSQASPGAIVQAVTNQVWSSAQTFPAYSATILVVSGAASTTPVAEWDLNPDTIQVPAGGTTTLQPRITSATAGDATVTLNSANFDTCTGTLAIVNPLVTQTLLTGDGKITVTPGNTTGFCHFTVMGTDSSGAAQTQSGWIVVGNQAASLVNGSPSTGQAGKTVTLSVTLNPGSSIGPPVCPNAPCPASAIRGASILFTVDSGSLSGGVYPMTSTSSTKQMVATANSAGVANVTLALPGAGTTVHVTAEGPYDLGHAAATFAVTVQ
jgi:hypothetical protein